MTSYKIWENFSKIFLLGYSYTFSYLKADEESFAASGVPVLVLSYHNVSLYQQHLMGRSVVRTAYSSIWGLCVCVCVHWEACVCVCAHVCVCIVCFSFNGNIFAYSVSYDWSKVSPLPCPHTHTHTHTLLASVCLVFPYRHIVCSSRCLKVYRHPF